MPQSSTHSSINPGLAIIVWLVCVIIAQSLDGMWLLAMFMAVGCVAFLSAPSRSRRILRRVRVLLLAILVLFGGFTPGEALLVDWPTLSPSREGVALALVHAGRLVCAVLCVAILMEIMSPSSLIAGVHALLRPFTRLGLPAERIAVRTMLVLQHVESAAPRHWRDWLQADDVVPAPVRFEAVRWSGLDRLLAIACGAVVAGLVLH